MVIFVSQVTPSESRILDTSTPVFVPILASVMDVKKKQKNKTEFESLENLCASVTIPAFTTRKAFTSSDCVNVTPWKGSMWFIVLGKPSERRIDCGLLLICWEVTFYADVALFPLPWAAQAVPPLLLRANLAGLWTETCFPHLQTCRFTFFYRALSSPLTCKFEIAFAVSFVIEAWRRWFSRFPLWRDVWSSGTSERNWAVSEQ